MRFGKKPARPDAVKLKFSAVFSAEKLPDPPAVFLHDGGLVKWGMLANDRLGDCVFAGAAHEHMMWTRAAHGHPAQFADSFVIRDYSAVAGYVPGDEDTDQGTDMQEAASYRRRVGIADALGRRHRVAAYMALKPGDWDQMILAAWLFGAVGVGIQVPADLEDQFEAQQPWSVTPDAQIVGGHYVPVVGRDHAGCATCVTWGRTQPMTREFYEKYSDETIAYLCPEYLDANKLSPDGFDADKLASFLRSLS